MDWIVLTGAIFSRILVRPAVSRVAVVSTSLYCTMTASSGISVTLALKLSGWNSLKILFLT